MDEKELVKEIEKMKLEEIQEKYPFLFECGMAILGKMQKVAE